MTAVAEGGSRRRAALLGSAPAPDQAVSRLSLADVERLRGAADTDARASIAEKLGRSFDMLAADAATGPLAGAILGLLVKDVEKTVRATLARAIAASPAVPSAIARKLATDEIEVARPVLEQSPVLSDEQLIEIVRTHAMQYALAVAGRQNLAARVCEALVESGDGQVVARLVGNESARLGEATLCRIADDFALDQEVQDRLVRRPELPYELVDQLVGLIGQRLQWELISSRQVSGEEARRLINAVREQATISMTARDHDARQALAELRQEHLDGGLDPLAALRALRDGRVARFEGIMSLLADLDLPPVRRLLYGMDKRGIVALCLRAGFATGHYLAVRIALDLAESGIEGGGRGSVYSQETLRFLQGQYERMRAQPDLVERTTREA